MENKMEEVAKLLDLELEEEFRVNDFPCKFKISKDGLKYWNVNIEQWDDARWLQKLLTGERKIIKIPKKILTGDEKEYLSAVIKPFRDKVSSISKRSSDDNGEYIAIVIEEKPHDTTMFFPSFDVDTMSKGMEIGKYYSLDELEL